MPTLHVTSTQGRRLIGQITDDPHFPAGSDVKTSPVVRLEGGEGADVVAVTRTGTRYVVVGLSVQGLAGALEISSSLSQFLFGAVP